MLHGVSERTKISVEQVWFWIIRFAKSKDVSSQILDFSAISLCYSYCKVERLEIVLIQNKFAIIITSQNLLWSNQ